MSQTSKLLLLTFIVCTVVACSNSRYSMKHDKGPSGEFDARQVPDATPVWEPLSRKGNYSPYEVRGKTYHLLNEVEGYQEEGVASWYGLKFHGELTSNGEVYNMYAMSAAHKTLPLPVYLRVTNLNNQRTVVVRVNDRGPFHGDRIIDLSYAAAKKLGFDKQGTAKVRLEAITPEAPERAANTLESTERSASLKKEKDRLSNYVQLAALSNKASAEALLQKLKALNLEYPAFVGGPADGSVYRVRVGPIDDIKRADKLKSLLDAQGLGEPIVITRPVMASGS